MKATGRIYALFDPRTPCLVDYVGWTTQPLERRLRQHRNDGRGGGYHRAWWIAKIARDGFPVGLRQIVEVPDLPDDVTARRAIQREVECYWIAYYRSLGQAKRNVTAGGDGIDSATAKALQAARSPEQRTASSLKACLTRSPEERSEATRKAAQTLGADGRRAKALKAQATLGPEGRSALVRKAAKTLGPEGLSAKALKAQATLGPEGRTARGRKACITIGAEGLRSRAIKANITRGAAFNAECSRKACEARGPEKLREAARKAADTRRRKAGALTGQLSLLF